MINARVLAGFALAAAAMAGGFVADASAQSRRLTETCDQICFNRPNAQCYQACFASKGDQRFSKPTPPPRRVLPVSVQSDWRSAVYNTSGPSRGGSSGGGNAGGGGGGGKAN